VAAAGLTLPAVMLARGMVGLGEGVALPAMNNLVANNIPPARRSTALGGCFTGFHTGQTIVQSINMYFMSWGAIGTQQCHAAQHTCAMHVWCASRCIMMKQWTGTTRAFCLSLSFWQR